MFSLGKIIFGMILMVVLQLMYFDQSTKIMVFSHNVFSETKIVYDAAKKVIEKRETIEKMAKLADELVDSTKVVSEPAKSKEKLALKGKE